MTAQTSEKLFQSSADATSTTPSRATLQTRPLVERALIRSWEYIRPVRITFLVIRMLVVMWLLILTALLVPAGYAWGWSMVPAAVAVLALSLWVFRTAEKGWPVEVA